jgi:hypothetical protein
MRRPSQGRERRGPPLTMKDLEGEVSRIRRDLVAGRLALCVIQLALDGVQGALCHRFVCCWVQLLPSVKTLCGVRVK